VFCSAVAIDNKGWNTKPWSDVIPEKSETLRGDAGTSSEKGGRDLTAAIVSGSCGSVVSTLEVRRTVRGGDDSDSVARIAFGICDAVSGADLVYIRAG
jgi:hypothetical protein